MYIKEINIKSMSVYGKKIYDQFSEKASSLISELEQNGVNFKSSNYVNNEEFKKLDSKYPVSAMDLTMSWAIECKVVSSELLSKIYGPYSMASKVPSSKYPNPYTKESFLNYLNDPDDIYIKLYPKVFDQYNLSKDHGLYFFRCGSNKKGIKSKLKDWGIDVDSFNDKESEFKLYFLIFLTEHNPAFFKCNFNKGGKTQKQLNLFKLLNNPTSESASRPGLGGNITHPRNADIIQFLKSETIKGIDLKYAVNVQDTFVIITTIWSNLLIQIHRYAYGNHNKDDSPKFFQGLHKIWNYFLHVHSPLIEEKKDKLLETFYLKLLEHEHIGIEHDLMLAYNGNKTLDASEVNPKILQYIEKSNEPIDINKVKEFIEKTNRKKYARIVFQSSKPTSNQYRSYDVACVSVIQLIQSQQTNGLIPIKQIYESYILIALDEYIKLDKNVKNKNGSYLHSSNEPRHLKNDILNGNKAFAINQFVWLRHIKHMVMCYLNDNDNDLTLIEKDISLILQSIYNANSFYDMIISFIFNYVIFEHFAFMIDALPSYYEELNSFLNSCVFVKCDNTDLFLLLIDSEKAVEELKFRTMTILSQFLGSKVQTDYISDKFFYKSDICKQEFFIKIKVKHNRSKNLLSICELSFCDTQP